jgi:hypothetical protein
LAVRRQRCRDRLLISAAVLLVVAALVGCSDEDEPLGPGPLEPVGPVGEESGIAGSGNVVSETRDVGAFTAIVFDSEGTVVVTTGEEASLVVEADDNLQQYLTTSASDNVLEVSTADGVDIAPSEPPVFRIGVGRLTAVDLAGVGTIDVSGIEATRLNVTLSGVGDVTINPATVGELVLDLNGSGTATFAGSADRLQAAVAGAAALSAADLEIKAATIDASGSCEVVVWVSDELEVIAGDAASVDYYGTPSVTQDVSGAASVASRGAK